jgi:serine/threonine protein kinase/tetratricopeptide (TPR) repeat protein
MDEGIPLGPFRLDRKIGRGGMADVWRGRHPDGTLVAVKALKASTVANSDFLAAFRSEVRAVAGLSHPRITRIYDHGVVPEESSLASGGRLVAGAPYLVMELAMGGTLLRHCGRLAWPDIKQALMAVLDGLAHAHARNVLHRDIKPANVLIPTEDFGAVQLTDFGLVHALDRQGGESKLDDEFVGTPAFMAPEQLVCRWRQYGPWTDLYAVGCLAWALCTGSSPFSGDTIDDVVHSHLVDGPGDFEPVHEMPSGFERWIRKLLKKRSGLRFRRAMDAAWGLALLSSSGVGSSRTRHAASLILPRPESVTAGSAAASGFVLTIEREAMPGRDQDARVPPFPSDWRRPNEDDFALALPLRGVGLSLFGLRAIGIVGRQDEQDQLWAALEATRREGSARLCLLEGPAGCGKTGLADWLAERAHEVGAASVVRARHSSRPGPLDGIGPMIAHQLRCIGLPPADARSRLRKLFKGVPVDVAEVSALAELVAPAVEETSRTARFGGASERHALVRRHLDRLSDERPVVVVLDDIQYSRDSIEFVANLLLAQAQSPAPILIVATAQSEALADRPATAAAMGALAAGEGTLHLHLGPLGRDPRRRLVRELLGLDGALASRVEERTAGNPLFAIQLVGDWVERGLLVPGARGFELDRGARAEVPNDLADVWGRRFERSLRGFHEADVRAVELAAVMGQDILMTEWEAACAQAGLRINPALVDHMFDSALARPHAAGAAVGWSFTHGMLRSALERRAMEAGHGPSLHRAAAAALRDRTERAIPPRLGRHLLAAGDAADAVEPLDKAVGLALYDGEVQDAELLLTEMEDAVVLADEGPQSRSRVRLAMLRGRVLRRTGQLDEAVAIAKEAAAAARSAGLDDLLARALLDHSNCLASRGEFQSARPLLEEGLRRAKEREEPATIAAAWRHLASLELCEGRLKASQDAAWQAIRAHDDMGDDMGVANTYLMLGRTTTALGNEELASRQLARAQEAFTRSGARWGTATVANTLGDMARRQGDVQLAEDQYRTAAATYEAIGSDDRVYPTINLALLLTESGRYGEARKLARSAKATFLRQGRRAMVAAACITMLPSLAAEEQWRAFDAEVAQGREFLEATGFKELDIARMAKLAGDVAAGRGDGARARVAYGIALAQYQGLERGDGVDEVTRALEGVAGLA